MVGKKLFVSIPAHGSDERVRVSAMWQINNTQYKNNKWRSKYKFDKTSNYGFAAKNSFHSVKGSSAKEFMSYESKKKFYIFQIHKSPDGSVIIYTSSAGDKNHSPGYLKSYVSNLLSKELNKKSALSESPTLTQYVDA
ncbi:hypothetical protein, partial [Methylobacterium sp. WL103]|uniref:hypothetical protein n=1 Tax=Methylobacterium sp. WL103 TaxID=2603891 RepID=UPI001AEF1D15